jgi:cation diffusion facilitator CzcD-associated flavoprotein CzcO
LLCGFRCACDIPAHNYTYSFEPKPDWASVYPSSSQIKGYFRGFCDKYDLTKYIKFRHKIVEAQYHETEGRWTVTIEDMVSGQRFDDQCNILINAGGYLNHWKWPDIPGLKDFEGELLHSANWNTDVDLDGKTVALIGNG